MISDINEVFQAKAILKEVQDELAAEKISFDPKSPLES